MNERIKELSSQARDYAREYVADCKQYGYYMEHNEFDLQFEAKFAKLLIQECVEQLELVRKYRYDRIQLFETQQTVVDECQYQIKQHFGVQE